MERLTLLADGVFAIALTLLALELRLPEAAEHYSGSQLLNSLMMLWPKLLSFAQSFVFLSSYWIAHHRTFTYIQRCDGRLVWLTMMQLLCISFLPFPTAVVGSHFNDPVAWEFYLGTLAVTSLILTATWLHATHQRRLVSLALDSRLIRQYHGLCVAPLLAAAVFLAILIAEPSSLIFVVIATYLVVGGFVILGLLDLFEPRDPHATATPQADHEP